MKQYHYLNTRLGQILFGAVFAAMLYLSRNTLVTTAILGFNRAQILLVVLVGLLGIGFLISCRREWKQILTDPRMVLAAVIAVLMLIPMVLKLDWQLMYFSILFCPLAAIFLSYFRNVRQISRLYVCILAVIGLYSILATYYLRGLHESGVITVPVFENSIQIQFYNFGLSFVSISYVMNRNFGIFREPGVYQYFLLLGLFLNNYRTQWSRGWVVWLLNAVLAAAMISTLATGGLIELGLFFLFLFFEKKLYRNPVTWIMILGIGSFAAWKFLEAKAEQSTLYWELYAMFVSKFQPGEDSWVDRIGSIFTNGELFIRSPLIGSPLSQVLYAVDNNTSSTMIQYAVFGALGGSVHVAAWIALVWEKKRGILANLFLPVILFMSFNTQNLTADLFFWLFPTMALAERGLPWMQNLLMRRKSRGA